MTPQQLATLKAAINANPTWAAFPLTADGFFDLAKALNLPASPNFWVWSTTADVQKIRAAIVWANLTPVDTPDGTATWTNRALQCQGKQFSLQLIVPMTGTLDASDSNLRNGLQDALTGIRSGAGGVAQSGGWTAVQQTLARQAKYVEKILADTTNGNGGTRATSATMVYEGDVTPDDVMLARTT